MTTPEPRIIASIPVASVVVTAERRRGAQESVIVRLMTSIERRGLLSPIRVREDLVLVCGLHRLVAHERLRRAQVDAIICEGDDIDAELDELEENLERRDLTVLERAMAERRQKVLYLLRKPATQRGLAGAVAKHDPQAKDLSFAAAQATSGSGKRMVEQRVQIAQALPDEMVSLIAASPIANNHTQLLALARVPERVRHAVAAAVAEGKARNVDAAVALVAGAPVASPKKPNIKSKLEGGLVALADALVGEVVFRGEALTLQVEPTLKTFTLRRSELRKPDAVRDARPLSVPISIMLAASTVAEFPSDVATDITVTTVTVEHARYCAECGSSRFWRGARFDYICLPCNPIRCTHCVIRFVHGECRQCEGSRFWVGHRGKVHCASCRAPHAGACDVCDATWERLYWAPFNVRDRVVLSSPRLAQTITCSSPSTGRSRTIDLRWWHAADRLRGEPPGAVLLEVFGVAGALRLVIGRWPGPPHAEELREALCTGLFLTLERTHDLQRAKGRYYRADGTEVRLLRGPSPETDGLGVLPLPLRP